jgi:hypothetical protein
MTQLSHSESILIAASPDAVYDLVSDVTRTGEWSPVCKECWWDEGATGTVGDVFTGRNVLPDRTWETRCTVTHAERGKEFGWIVGDSLVRWVYSMEPAQTGTRLTESWAFLPNGIALFRDRYGDDADAQIANRTDLARRGISQTLLTMKGMLEGS